MSKKSFLLSFVIVSLLLSACATDNVQTSKKSSGDINYVKDNSYYMTKKDGTRYVLSGDDIEDNIEYTRRKTAEMARTSGFMDLNLFFSGFGFDKTDTRSLKDKYEAKNYYPDNFYDYNKNLSIYEIDFDSTIKSFVYKISTGSIISKEKVKKEIVDESEYLIKETIEDTGFEITFSPESSEVVNEEDVPFLEEDDLSFNNFEELPEGTVIEESTPSEVFIEEERTDRIYGLKEGEYYLDSNNNSIYYYSDTYEFNKYNYVDDKKETIDTDVKAIRMYGKKVIYIKDDKVIFYTVGKGVESSFDTQEIRNSYFKKSDSDNIYITSLDDNLKLYIINKKSGLKLIDEDVEEVFGLTTNRIFYSKPNIITLPYKNVLIDDVSSGEFMGEEPILRNYRLNDDPLSFDYDIEKYTADRFSYKIKEKFLNDRKKYIDKYIEGIKEGGEEISVSALMSSDGTTNTLINKDGVVNVVVLNEDEDVVYFETDLALDTIQLQKKHLGEFVTSSYTVDSFISPLLDNRRKQYTFYVDKAGEVYHINDLDLYRKYIERNSRLIYDSVYNKELSALEKREIHYEDNKVFISGVSAAGNKKVAFVLPIEKSKEIFADSINIENYRDIHFVGFIDSPVYLLEEENGMAVLRHGIKELSNNVYIGSVVIDSKETNIAYVTKKSDDEKNCNGVLHKVSVKNHDDYIVSENAFAYNLVFDENGNLYYLLKYTIEDNIGTLLSIDSNNKKSFIDDEVIYILKY